MSFYVLRVEQHGITGEAAYRLQHAALHRLDFRRYILLDDGFYELPTGTYCSRRQGVTVENVRRLAYDAVKSLWPAEPSIECMEVASLSFSGLKKINAVEWDLEMSRLWPAVEARKASLARSLALRETARRLAASHEHPAGPGEVIPMTPRTAQFPGLAPIVRRTSSQIRPMSVIFETKSTPEIEESPSARIVEGFRVATARSSR